MLYQGRAVSGWLPSISGTPCGAVLLLNLRRLSGRTFLTNQAFLKMTKIVLIKLY